MDDLQDDDSEAGDLSEGGERRERPAHERWQTPSDPAAKFQDLKWLDPAAKFQDLKWLDPAAKFQDLKWLDPAAKFQDLKWLDPAAKFQDLKWLDPAAKFQDLKWLDPAAKFQGSKWFGPAPGLLQSKAFDPMEGLRAYKRLQGASVAGVGLDSYAEAAQHLLLELGASEDLGDLESIEFTPSSDDAAYEALAQAAPEVAAAIDRAAEKVRTPFWSRRVVRNSLAWFLVMLLVTMFVAGAFLPTWATLVVNLLSVGGVTGPGVYKKVALPKDPTNGTA